LLMPARYTGCSMGVISLQGEAQAKLIEHKLLERLEPEVIEARRLICGNAYAFQGDERHIIFLGMVSAPGEIRIGVLANDAARLKMLMSPKVRFAADSPVEGAGFEPSAPLRYRSDSESRAVGEEPCALRRQPPDRERDLYQAPATI
jgi:hypothetical protein